jgi:uncharacterized protein YpuA (DUF1002 family)
VTDFHDDNKDEMNEVSQESLGNLKAQAEQNKFTLKKEDIQTIVSELVNSYNVGFSGTRIGSAKDNCRTEINSASGQSACYHNGLNWV